MKRDSFNFDGESGQKIFVRKWSPNKKSDVKGVMQIVHGMAEHSERYDEFAENLVSEGYIVYANDHIGHGQTAKVIEELGFLADSDGWQKLVDDIKSLKKKIKSEFPDLPYFILGHSMGSFLLRTLIIQNDKSLSGVILSGTGNDPGLLGKIGVLIVKNEIWRKGKRFRSKLLTYLSFGSFNKYFKPVKTNFDWLSRDNDIVNNYINDPFCGTVFTSGFYLDLLKGVIYVNKKKYINMVQKDLPILLISGDKDPVGKNGKGVKAVFDNFNDAGIHDVEINLYKDARHEIINEINRDEVYADILEWMKKKSCKTN